jgi:hypothetical protein
MATRKDPERHRDQVRAANRARYAATRMLVERHQAEFDALYHDAAKAEGVVPKPRGRIDADAMRRHIAELEARLAGISDSA